jgi:hypothetical protein
VPIALRTGGEIDSFCTKCRMLLAHTILAIEGGKPARVQCNTCHSQHAFRRAPGEQAAKSSAAKPRTSVPKRATFDEEMAKRTGIPKSYSPKNVFQMDDTLSHPTFGRGFVCAVRADKIDVTFSAGVKTLIHGRV